MLEGRNSNYPQFQCPNCRAYADLDADVDIDMSEWQEDSTDQNIDLNIDQTDRPHTSLVEDSVAESLGDTSMQDVTVMTGADNDDAARSNAPATGSHDATTNRTLPIMARRKQQGSSEVDHSSSALSALPMPARPSQAEMADLLEQQRTQAGSPDQQQIIAGEGPLTPRNNAGPFVFDGSGSRAGSRRRINAPETRNLSEVSDSVD